VEVSLAAAQATVQYDERLTSIDQLKMAIAGAGYGLGGSDAADGRQSKGSCCA
jgi:copper chaperone CopZ